VQHKGKATHLCANVDRMVAVHWVGQQYHSWVGLGKRLSGRGGTEGG
jgi:hypothetical protein